MSDESGAAERCPRETPLNIAAAFRARLPPRRSLANENRPRPLPLCCSPRTRSAPWGVLRECDDASSAASRGLFAAGGGAGLAGRCGDPGRSRATRLVLLLQRLAGRASVQLQTEQVPNEFRRRSSCERCRRQSRRPRHADRVLLRRDLRSSVLWPLLLTAVGVRCERVS
jgi:hypothetical protein